MTNLQFMGGLAFAGAMAFAGSFAATWMQGDAIETVHAQEADADVHDSLKVRELVLVDENGETRGLLDIGKDGGARFSLLGTKESVGVQISAAKDKSSVGIFDSANKPRFVQSVDNESGMVQSAMNDSNGQIRNMLALQKGGTSLLSFDGVKKEGQKAPGAITIMGGGDDTSTVIVADMKSKHAATILAGQGQATVQLDDSEGEGGVLMSALKDTNSFLALSTEGKMRLRAMSKKEGDPELILLNKERQATWRAGKK